MYREARSGRHDGRRLNLRPVPRTARDSHRVSMRTACCPRRTRYRTISRGRVPLAYPSNWASTRIRPGRSSRPFPGAIRCSRQRSRSAEPAAAGEGCRGAGNQRPPCRPASDVRRPVRGSRRTGHGRGSRQGQGRTPPTIRQFGRTDIGCRFPGSRGVGFRARTRPPSLSRPRIRSTKGSAWKDDSICGC
jgi:hypothetical protein